MKKDLDIERWEINFNLRYFIHPKYGKMTFDFVECYIEYHFNRVPYIESSYAEIVYSITEMLDFRYGKNNWTLDSGYLFTYSNQQNDKTYYRSTNVEIKEKNRQQKEDTDYIVVSKNRNLCMEEKSENLIRILDLDIGQFFVTEDQKIVFIQFDSFVDNIFEELCFKKYSVNEMNHRLSKSSLNIPYIFVKIDEETIGVKEIYENNDKSKKII